MVERVSISIDDEGRRKIEFLRRKMRVGTSELIRELINLGYLLIKESEVDSETISIWIDYLSKKQHMILDIEHWRVIFSEIEKISSNEGFWEKMKEIGFSHAIQYKIKGLDTIEKVINYVEKANWYDVKKENEGVYTLILNDLAIKKFVKIFLEEVFKGQKLPARIEEGFGKLIVIDTIAQQKQH